MKFIIEQSAYSGVLKITGKVAHDMELVTGTLPEISVVETIDHEEVRSSAARELTIIVATMEHSRWLDAQKNIPTDVLKGKRECYGWFFPDDGLRERLLVIVGSDKRGTIYGLFHLSEIFGVSPFVNWCHVVPVHRDEIRLSTDMACIAKEPSVEYRGFFINDEWPAFGTWSEYHFGGPNAKAYEPIFELLLRLKGNYLWPAMWSARFEDDGPGLLNAELADEYGVIMGMSHHEPCLRQGEEYKYLRGKDSIYGDAWNFKTNREGIIRFWEDGLKRSGKFENVITVGMRGEADTAIMGKGATLADNIELLRDVLRTQRKLIRENVNEDLSKVPRMIALYKEVEAFFYGDETTQGLIGSKELYDVILMLCDDNYGNLRTLPTEEMRKHPGGYGMYYHFDYHGWPTSYEWINSSYLPKIWEQMTQAYDFGVQKLWIVNVGDIATQEFPLSFFMDLAYDFERWGTTAPNTTDAYTRLWVKWQFSRLSEVQQAQIADILTDYTRMIHKCRPEALRPETYHAANYREGSRVLAEVGRVMQTAQDLYDELERVAPEILPAYVALVWYPTMGTMNVLKLQLLSGMNHYLAEIGALSANDYAKEVKACLDADQKIIEQYHRSDDARWYGMGLSQHIGFTNWNEDECKNPLLMQVLPLQKPTIIATVDGTMQHVEGSPWLNQRMTISDFLNPECRYASISLYSRSELPASFRVIEKPEWIVLSAMDGTLDGEEHKRLTIDVTVDESALAMALTDGRTQGMIRLELPAGICKISVPVDRSTYEYGNNTFVDTQGWIAIEAEHYSRCKDGFDREGQPMQWKCLAGYGKTLSAMKAFPTDSYADAENGAPYIEYSIVTKQAGDYEAEFYMQPSNPVTTENRLQYAVSVNDVQMQILDAVTDDFKIGDHQPVWARGVLDQIRCQSVPVQLEQGINTIRVTPVTPGFVLEKIVIYPHGNKPAEAYLGPTETYRCRS